MSEMQNMILKMVFSVKNLTEDEVNTLVSKHTLQKDGYKSCNQINYLQRYTNWVAISDYLVRKLKTKAIYLSKDIEVVISRENVSAYVQKWNDATDIVFCDCFYILENGEVMDMCDYLSLLLDKDKSEVLNFKFTSAYELEE